MLVLFDVQNSLLYATYHYHFPESFSFVYFGFIFTIAL